MTLRVRLLSLMLAMVVLVALTLIALSLNTLVGNSLDVASSSSEYAAQQVHSFILRRLSDPPPPAHAGLEGTKRFWREELANDTELSALLEQTMAQSRSIVEINVAGEDGVIIASSNPGQIGARMSPKAELRALRDTNNPFAKLAALLTSSEDYETRGVPLGVVGQQKPLFSIQVLVSSVFLRDVAMKAIQKEVYFFAAAMLLAFIVAFWSSNLALRPLNRIGHIIDAINSGNQPLSLDNRIDSGRELVIIESKLSLLGERFRDARQDATQLRSNLEGVLAKLDSGTRQHFENQLALARRLTAINSLTGRVAHEIKNPLNSIALRLEMLRSRIAEESPESEPEFAILSEEVTRLDRVVRTFLDFNRPVELMLQDVDVVECAAEILHLMELEATQKGIEISLEHPDEPVIVQADPDLLRQALLNIEVNAIEAMENGGKLHIAIEKHAETCLIRMQDTGPGIPPDKQDKIFQLYYTTKPKGSGIGLAMTFRAVQLHGGTIEVEGRVGHGTTFRVTLPLAGMDRIV